jgi:amidophosphoribosyltransferase
MCGIVGIVGTSPVNQRLYDALTVLQHRGQDAAGIATAAGGALSIRKGSGLVRDAFQQHDMNCAATWVSAMSVIRPRARMARPRRSPST